MDSRVHVLCDCFYSSLRMRELVPEFVLFNPPYVESSAAEVAEEQDYTACYAGGTDGAEVIRENLVGHFFATASSRTRLLCLVAEPNRPMALAKLYSRHQFSFTTLSKKKCEGEFLRIVLIQRQDHWKKWSRNHNLSHPLFTLHVSTARDKEIQRPLHLSRWDCRCPR